MLSKSTINPLPVIIDHIMLVPYNNKRNCKKFYNTILKMKLCKPYISEPNTF